MGGLVTIIQMYKYIKIYTIFPNIQYNQIQSITFAHLTIQLLPTLQSPTPEKIQTG